MRQQQDELDAFGARIGAALRRPEAVPSGFEARLGSALEAERRRAATPWLTRRREFRLSPLAGLALAASFAGLVILGTLGVTGRGAAPVVAASAPDTVHLVRFVLVNPTASQVALVGDFNGWQGAALERSGDAASGVWSVSLPLAAGRYEYAFVVDGKRWIADPALPRMRDEFGGEHSVLRLGADRVM
jgi:Glycogen recognition site of AMP-activated protein kinase